MHVSAIELKAALRRCFEASGFYVGNYEDAADMVLWLEAHGLNGLDELQKALPVLSDDATKPSYSISHEDSNSTIIDSKNRSALDCVCGFVDLAQSIAEGCEIATVTVHNCLQRKFVIKAITDCGRRGINAEARWCTTSEEGGKQFVTEHTASIKSADQFPSYKAVVINQGNTANKPQTLKISCGPALELSDALQASSTNQDDIFIRPDQIQKNKENSVDNGIDINQSLWSEINHRGAGVLVENSENSRQGAGES